MLVQITSYWCPQTRGHSNWPAAHALWKRGHFDIAFDGPSDPDALRSTIQRELDEHLLEIFEASKDQHGCRLAWEEEKIRAEIERRPVKGSYEPPSVLMSFGRRQVGQRRFSGERMLEEMFRGQ